jgi:hypothetical protein
MFNMRTKSILLPGLFGILLFSMGSNVYADIIYGDVDGNGIIDITDAMKTAQVSEGIEVPGFIAEAADVNCDETISIEDALMIAQHYVGLIEIVDCHQPEQNEWGFFIYMNGDNSLYSYAEDDLFEMTSSPSSDDVKVVSLYDSIDTTGKILYIADGETHEVEDWGETNMGDGQTLANFGKWAVENYPANHYALILWDHGDGWRDAGTTEDAPLFKAFSGDDSHDYDKIQVSNGEYAAALAEITEVLGRKIDIVGFDACLMGMWEVAAATAPYADYLIASEAKEPGPGWDYNGFLSELAANPSMSPEELAVSIIDAFHDYYEQTSKKTTLSLVDLSTIDELSAAISDLAESMMADESYFEQITIHRDDSAKYYSSESTMRSIDLKGFAINLEQDSTLPAEMRNHAASVIAEIEGSVVYHQAHDGYFTTYGMAIFFPIQRDYFFEDEYTAVGAVWSATTKWDEFLSAIVTL